MNIHPWGPVAASERVEVIDVLRGVALFGVFLVNMCGFCSAGVMATQAQLDALPSRIADTYVSNLVEIFFADKANTLFAFSFGLSFYLQMKRAEARDVDFASVYRRRLTVLLCFGVAHLLFVWNWDILHLYALLGFVLLGMRKLSNRVLLGVGIVLTLVDWRIPQELVQYLDLENWHGLGSVYSDTAVVERQHFSEAGNYAAMVGAMARFTLIDYVLTGALAAWLLYVLGRFLLGAWVGRHGWLEHSQRYIRGFKIMMIVCLPLGIALMVMHRWLWQLIAEGRYALNFPLVAVTLSHAVAVPILAAGYVCAIVVAMNTNIGSKVFRPFAYAGRMALSNYVSQSFVYAFVLFGIGPSLALAGKIGASIAAAIVVVAYAAQVIVSRWWLARFRFGPLEWAWRGLTYGVWPTMRVTRSI